MSAPLTHPKLPFAGFPLRHHRNGQWFRSIWNPRTRKSEQFYFGTWADDPEGERALNDPVLGCGIMKSLSANTTRNAKEKHGGAD